MIADGFYIVTKGSFKNTFLSRLVQDKMIYKVFIKLMITLEREFYYLDQEGQVLLKLLKSVKVVKIDRDTFKVMNKHFVPIKDYFTN